MSGPKGKFTQALFDKICNIIATSSTGIHKACQECGIQHTTFYNWIQDDAELMNQYVRAREQQAEFLADEIIAIADDGSRDTKTIRKGGEVIEVEDLEWTNRSKLRVEARKWVAAKLKPKRYGDKVEVDQNISVKDMPDWLKDKIE